MDIVERVQGRAKKTMKGLEHLRGKAEGPRTVQPEEQKAQGISSMYINT